ncbi:PqiC family protein [Tateyamaria omphalii]|uniref:PqiC family protein n=1 Tax=Tateyamaria omphalii TaxID=299262 RepID=UPI001C99EF36|nr:ABC-type transport auxiliary lipoprotein family protein [Tateyamaria omphalii]MBY5934729.1 PqiC family protein [Tateyamaria omphalii]
MRHALGLIALSLVMACGSPDQFVASPKLVAQERIPSRFASIEVADISLPAYAARDEITANDGDLLVLSDTLWADQPTRAMTLALTRHLAEITGRRVASEPWPFDGFASGRVEVRVEDLSVVADQLRMSGQYYVVDLDGRGRDHAHLFELSTPVADGAPASVAQARARLLVDLATRIARDGL